LVHFYPAVDSGRLCSNGVTQARRSVTFWQTEGNSVHPLPGAGAAMKTRIQLRQTHTHAGTVLLSGAEIEVDVDQADWLLALGVADSIPPDSSSLSLTDSPTDPASQAGLSKSPKEKRL
jgi:hypothetical protein